MAYEIYTRDVIRVNTPMVTLNGRGRIVFNVAATKKLHEAGVETVFLMWDKDGHKLAVRATNKKDTRAYTIRYSSGHKWAAISAKGFLVHIGHDMNKTACYEATWNADQMMLEAETYKPKQESSLVTKKTEPPAQRATSSNGHTTRTQAVANFLREHGPATRAEIISRLDIPVGTAAYVLNHRETFVNRDGRWHLVA